MELKTKFLCVIPARGGSKGIPRKNIRTLAGKPLIYFSIKTALDSQFKPDVYVTTDDDEIAMIAQKLGAKIIKRNPDKAKDETTLDPVIFDAYQQATQMEGKIYDFVVTLQPTSPLLKTLSLDKALGKIARNPDIDTIISAREDTHLTWKCKDDIYIPNYVKRVNRQYLEPIFKETGGFLITRSKIITEGSRIGSNVKLHLLHGGEDIDIDTYEDWNLCEYYLRRRKILFVVSGNQNIGLGHVYNTLILANDILNHQVEFLVDNKSQLAFDAISSKYYKVHMQSSVNIVDDIRSLAPDVVINDCLDTTESYINSLKQCKLSVINFEDLGSGARFADLVINAIYPEKVVLPKHFFGHKYFILRDEFILTKPITPSEHVRRVLLTFGGVDPNNFTHKVLQAIHPFCQDQGIEIAVVAGFGYTAYDALAPYQNINIFRNSMNIAEHMSNADVIFTSAGRTTYEAASLHVPSIVLAQNEREITHFFTSAEFGFLNLGLGTSVSQNEILQSFVRLVDSYPIRLYMSQLMAKTNLFTGRKRVLKLINDNILEHI